ncbi:hypothetical protein ACOX9P_09000 [Enterococcus durans]|uniref:hypothetical protein n=1 Tax=Enterococcus durans TaxID=53345 RepID=UPI003BEF36E7
MTIIDTNKIKALLDSDVSAYEIEKRTKLNRNSIGMLRAGKQDIMRLTLENAKKLQDFWEEYMMEKYEELKKFIEEDLEERDFGRGLEAFDINDLYKNGFVETSTETGDTKVLISLNELQLENVKDVYMSDFGKDEIYVYYTK